MKPRIIHDANKPQGYQWQVVHQKPNHAGYVYIVLSKSVETIYQAKQEAIKLGFNDCSFIAIKSCVNN